MGRTRMTRVAATSGSAESGLPSWRHVLVVVAHPDDESFGLGAVIDAFVRSGAQVDVLCLTHGEASTLAASGDLGELRATELAEAGRRLGVARVTLCDFPDGALGQADRAALDSAVAAAVEVAAPDGLLVFDPSGVTGHPDHRAATASAARAAGARGLPVLAWALPLAVAEALNGEFGAALSGAAADQIDVQLSVSRTAQLRAVQAHASQAVPGSILWRRLELLGAREVLRWLPTLTPPTEGPE